MANETVSPLMDIRDNVQHLRKIHFSLLVACFVLFTLTFAREDNQYEKALKQLNQIRAVLVDWAPGWVDSAAADLVAGLDDALTDDLILGTECLNMCETVNRSDIPTFDMPVYERELKEEGLQLLVLRPWTPLPLPLPFLKLAGAGSDPQSGPLWSKMAKLKRLDPQFVNPVPRNYPLDYQPLDITPPESVEEFQELWNTLDVLTLSYAIREKGYWVHIGSLNSGAAHVIRPDNPLDASWPTVELALEPMEDSEKAWWRDRTEHEMRPEYQLIGHTPWGEVTLPVESQQITISLRDAFIHRHGLSWTNGTFANNFPDLTVALKEHTLLSFDETAALLSSESAKLETDIVIFGLAIPSAAVSRWGGVIMVIAQFYFWLHLRGFARELKRTTKPTLTPWIGVYSDPLARVTTAVSGFALPPVILAALIFGASKATIMLGLIVVMSLLLGALAFTTLKACWTAIDLATGQNP